MAALVETLRHAVSEAVRFARANRSGLAALATLVFIVLAILRRRFKLGMMLFHVAVALGQKWQEGRARRRVGDLLIGRPHADSTVGASVPPRSPASPPNHP